MKKTFEYPIVFSIILLGIVMGISQTIYYLVSTPSGTVFSFAHNHLEDYYYYLHVMRQGFEGNLLATSWMTPEINPPKLVVTFFVLLGHLSRSVGISPPIMYTLARITGGLSLFILTYILIFLVYPNSPARRITALVLVIFGTYFWEYTNNHVLVPSLVHDWTELDPIFRVSYIPHHLWSKVFMVLAFILLLQFSKKNNIWLNIVILCTVVFFMGFTSPVTLVTFVPVVIIWFLREIGLSSKNKSGMAINPILFLIVLSVAAFTVLYHRFIQLGVFPWNSYIAWEKVQYQIPLLSYIQSQGPNLIFFIPAIWWLLRRGSVGRLMVIWVGAGYFMLFIAGRILPLSNIRFLEGYQFIPLGIGATQGIWIMAKYISSGNRKMEKFTISAIVFTLLVYYSIGLFASWQEHLGYVRQNMNDKRVYIPVSLIRTFKKIEETTPKDSVVLAPYSISTMIPAMTGRRVVAGHPMMTYEAENKRKDMDLFFSFGSGGKIREMIAEYRIAYVLSDVEIPSDFTRQNGLVKIYQSNNYYFYKLL